MDGFALGQPFGFGRTQQSTIRPGTGGAPNVPAAGANYLYPLQRYDYWRLIGAAFTLTTDANAADRFVQVQYPDGTAALAMADLTTYKQVASTTVTYYGALRGLIAQDAAANVSASFRLSGLWLEVGRTVTIAVGGIQVGDQLSSIRLTFDRTLVYADGSEVIRRQELEHELDQELAEASRG